MGHRNDVKLTDSELKVVAEVAKGSSSKEAAKALSVSKRTVDFHLANVYEKLGVGNRVQMLRKAVALGFVPPNVLSQ